MTRITEDVFVDTYQIAGVTFTDAVWGRDPDSQILLPGVKPARCIMHMQGGNTIAFNLPDGVTPETILDRLGIDLD